MTTGLFDFETSADGLLQRIAVLEAKTPEPGSLVAAELDSLRRRANSALKAIYSSLTPWQCAQVARHPQRPFALDYIASLFSEFVEFHGDRRSGDDAAIVAGFARFQGQSCVLVGQQKGRDTKEKLARNFGMPRPDGYRKAQRAFQMAAKFALPLICFVDTPGAFPGIDAEERGQSEAIGQSLLALTNIDCPVISVITGEGGSGGALALAVSDKIAMLRFSVYSVISPEGCASILWKTAERAGVAAEAMAITAAQLKTFGLIDDVIDEAAGGAHRYPKATYRSVGDYLATALKELASKSRDMLIAQRMERLANYGQFNIATLNQG